MTKMMTVIAAALVAGGLTISAPASAEPVKVAIDTRGIDTQTPGGRAELRKRAQQAAIDNCGKRSSVDMLSGRAIKECRAEVIAKAMTQAEETLLAKR